MTALALVAAGCAPHSVTEQGRAVYNLYNLFLYTSPPYVIVAALVIWSVVRYRRRNDELPCRPTATTGWS